MRIHKNMSMEVLSRAVTYIAGAGMAAVLGIFAQQETSNNWAVGITAVTGVAGAFIGSWIKGYWDMRKQKTQSDAALSMTDRQALLVELKEIRERNHLLESARLEDVRSNERCLSDVKVLQARLEAADSKLQMYARVDQFVAGFSKGNEAKASQ
jgi:uncharacterized membrane protein YeaQ/YmgE (transglycosylase-associated protein family)